MEAISSPQNPSVKLAKSLALKKHRAETGLFLAEGAKVLRMAAEADWPVHTLFEAVDTAMPELRAWIVRQKARHLAVSQSVSGTISAQDNPSGVAAILHQRYANPPVPDERAGTWLALEDIRDPGNLGTIIRSADAAGASGILLLGNACDPFSKECVRATMGSIFNVPLVRLDDKALEVLASKWRGDIIATSMRGETDYRRSYRLPPLIVMGSEDKGLSPEVARLCTVETRIPMWGKAESLNVAIATALMLYEVRRNQ